jgi:hypothetical protein
METKIMDTEAQMQITSMMNDVLRGNTVSSNTSNSTSSSTASGTTQRAKTLATIHFMKTQKNIDTARSILYTRENIKTSYKENSARDLPGVMVFSTVHSARDSMNAYAQECNGLVLSLPDYSPLVVPPRTLRTNIDTDASNKFLHQGLYYIYKAEDGTCFNMYYNKVTESWAISTNRGYYMNNATWNAGKTYQQIVTECLEKYGITWDIFTKTLNPKFSYSFGFKHPIMHKFMENDKAPIYRLWFIHSVCTDPSSPQYLWANENSPISIIPTQQLYTQNVNNLRDLYKKAASSLNDFITKREVCYGFILRSADPNTTKDHSDLFIESSLMRAIRKFWYDNSIVNMCHENKWNKDLALSLHAFLDTSQAKNFMHLFPQFSKHMAVYEEYINILIADMCGKQSEEKKREVVGIPQILKNDKDRQQHRLLVEEMAQLFGTHVQCTLDDNNRSVLYREFVMSFKSMPVIMRHMAEVLEAAVNG